MNTAPQPSMNFETTLFSHRPGFVLPPGFIDVQAWLDPISDVINVRARRATGGWVDFAPLQWEVVMRATGPVAVVEAIE